MMDLDIKEKELLGEDIQNKSINNVETLSKKYHLGSVYIKNDKSNIIIPLKVRILSYETSLEGGKDNVLTVMAVDSHYNKIKIRVYEKYPNGSSRLEVSRVGDGLALTGVEIGTTILVLGFYFTQGGITSTFNMIGGFTKDLDITKLEGYVEGTYKDFNTDEISMPETGEDGIVSGDMVRVNISKHIDTILNLVKQIKDESLKSACSLLLKDDKIVMFNQWPAAEKMHHAYIGGLVTHTAEVMSLVGAIHSKIDFNLDIVMTAALFHDFAKIYEYTQYGSLTDYIRLKGHICGSAEIFGDMARLAGVKEDIKLQVVHCILSHHGEKEYGSPVKPCTFEAIVLHQSDMLSAGFGGLVDYSKDNLDYYIK